MSEVGWYFAKVGTAGPQLAARFDMSILEGLQTSNRLTAPRNS